MLKIGAVGKRIAADRGHAALDLYGFDCKTGTIPRNRVGKAAVSEVGHLPRARNRQHTVIVERPCQVVAAGAGGGSARRFCVLPGRGGVAVPRRRGPAVFAVDIIDGEIGQITVVTRV